MDDHEELRSPLLVSPTPPPQAPPQPPKWITKLMSHYNSEREGSLLLKRLGLGFLTAAFVCMLLVSLLLVSALLGVGLVHLWAEEPLSVTHKVYFDYTLPHPTALFPLDANNKRNVNVVPVGRTFDVSLVLLLPESTFNRHVGVFQVSAELLSANGKVITKSSQPIMLRYRSFPVRLARTLIMGIPILLGIFEESQKITIDILKHKEDSRRTKTIKATVSPRAGTSSVPQIYEAEIVMKSQLPRAKQLVHTWKWTFYVWVSLFIYMMLLMILLCCCRTLALRVIPEYFREYSRPKELKSTEAEESPMWESDENEVSELLRKLRQSQSKRKEILTQGDHDEAMGSSASSITMTREEVTSTAVEDVEDSESVCLS